ncbi:MAG: hypothetical protein WC565_03020 [Parcubacteria group bacterium]
MASSDPQTLLNQFDEDLEQHESFVSECEKRYDAYRGHLDQKKDAASWTNKAHPAYVLQEIETIAASLIDPNPGWKVGARSVTSVPEDIEIYRAACQALEARLRYVADVSGFLASRRVHRIQGLVCGVSVDKTAWAYQKRDRTYRQLRSMPVLGRFGIERWQTVTEEVVVKDDPTCEVVDVRHFIVPKNAISLEKAERVTHRVYMPFKELKRLEKTEDNPNGIYSNVDALKESRGFAQAAAFQSNDVFGFKPDKDDVELLETWHKAPNGAMELTVIGNRKALLRDQNGPFWHDEFPFTISSPMPYPFRLRGLSDVEFLEKLQELLWAFMNQRLDNVQLLNNAIILIRSDVDDINSFEYAPGAQWEVDDTDQVKPLELNPYPAEASLRTEEMLRGDMQNIVGGLPFATGTESATIDQQTATGVSIITNLAQRRIAAKKQNFTVADAAVANQFIELDRQFLTETRWQEIVGEDGLPAFMEINPDHWQDLDLKVKVEAMDESLVRQEKRAEAQAKLQVAVNAAPVFQATGNPLNLKSFMDDYLDAFGERDKARYYTAQPQAQLPQQGQPPEPGQPGATAPQAADINSPSNAFSQSPVAAEQQMGAMAGGPVNQ